MPTYNVAIVETITTQYRVNAPDESAAQAIAERFFDCGATEGYQGVNVEQRAIAVEEVSK